MTRLAILAWIACLFWIGMCLGAIAQEHHERHHPNYQNWINQADKGCCNNQDCGELRAEDERITAAGIAVKVAGEWCPVLPQHYLKRGNAPDWSTAHVCIQSYDAPSGKPCDRLLCYQPKPGT